MRKRSVVVVVGLVLGALLVASLAVAAGGKKNFRAGDLVGYEENPDISTVATGSFKATIDEDAQTIEYELSYSGLEGTVLQAHIHFGKRAINGGITVFLCGTAASPGRQVRPRARSRARSLGRSASATSSRPEHRASKRGTSPSSSPPCANGSTYANVHSTKWPGGEIRAQINDR